VSDVEREGLAEDLLRKSKYSGAKGWLERMADEESFSSMRESLVNHIKEWRDLDVK
jgi:hypothetical protein